MDCAYKDCQFTSGNISKYSYGSKHYCLFHLPYEAKEDEKGNKQGKATWDDGEKSDFKETVYADFQSKQKLHGENFNYTGTIFPSNFMLIHLPAEGSKKNAVFKDCHFHGDLETDHAIFYEDVSFESVTFHKRALFRNATFSSGVSFKGATFIGDADFSIDHLFSKKYDYRCFFNDVDFTRADFKQKAWFNYCRFVNETCFIETTFGKAPDFANAVFNEDIRFEGAKFNSAEFEEAPYYRLLEKKMDEIGALKYKAIFFAKEQDCMIHFKKMPLTQILATFIYRIASDYGRSFLQPLLWFLVFQGLFYYLYDFFRPPLAKADTVTMLVMHIFRPFSFLGLPEMYTFRWPMEIYVVGVFHSIITYALVTLFLLAIRRTFRMQ